MTSNELIATTKAQLEAAAELIGGSAWGADKGKPRIYMNSRRDIKCYFAFDDYPTGDSDDLLGGARLCVYIDDCGQTPKWYASQKQIVADNMQTPGLALAALHAGDTQLAADIMEADDDYSGAEIDEASGHLVNGRLAEARATLSL